MRTALHWAGRITAGLVIMVALAALLVAVLVPRIAGATPYTILTGSMRPHLPPGTLVVVRPTAPSDIRIGDIVTYQIHSGDPTVVTHRVVAEGVTLRGAEVFRTEGDANTAPDPGWVRPVQLKGKLWYAVPWLGYVSQLLTRSQHQWVVYLVATALVGYGAAMFTGAARDRLRRRPHDPADPARPDPAQRVDT